MGSSYRGAPSWLLALRAPRGDAAGSLAPTRSTPPPTSLSQYQVAGISSGRKSQVPVAAGWRGSHHTWVGESSALAGQPTCAVRPLTSRLKVNISPTRELSALRPLTRVGLVREVAGGLSHLDESPVALVNEPLGDHMAGWAWLGSAGAAVLWASGGWKGLAGRPTAPCRQGQAGCLRRLRLSPLCAARFSPHIRGQVWPLHREFGVERILQSGLMPARGRLLLDAPVVRS